MKIFFLAPILNFVLQYFIFTLGIRVPTVPVPCSGSPTLCRSYRFISQLQYTLEHQLYGHLSSLIGGLYWPHLLSVYTFCTLILQRKNDIVNTTEMAWVPCSTSRAYHLHNLNDDYLRVQVLFPSSCIISGSHLSSPCPSSPLVQVSITKLIMSLRPFPTGKVSKMPIRVNSLIYILCAE